MGAQDKGDCAHVTQQVHNRQDKGLPPLSPEMEKAAVDALVQFLDDMSRSTAKSVVGIVYSAACSQADPERKACKAFK